MILYMITAINKKIRGSGGLALIAPAALSIICLAAGCSPPDPVHSEVTRPVKTMVVAAGEEARERSFSGRVEASKTADLAFSVAAFLVKLPVKNRHSVATGELTNPARPVGSGPGGAPVAAGRRTPRGEIAAGIAGAGVRGEARECPNRI